MTSYYLKGLKINAFKVFLQLYRTSQEIYTLCNDKHWEKAEKKWKSTVHRAFFERLMIEVKLGAAEKKITAKYKKKGINMFWEFIKQRYTLNTNIKRHKKEKPMSIKKKAFMHIKGIYKAKRQMLSDMIEAGKHFKEHLLKTSFRGLA